MKKIFPTALFLALLVACSSGGGSDNGGIGGTGFSQGVVTDISNSARVTGTLWETDANTTFLPTGEASEADLQVGRVVQIEGSTGATNLATRVRIDDIIRGPVSAPQDIEPPEAGLREFEILGMRVVMSLDATIYVGFPDPGAPDVAGFDNLVLNQNVSVSGFQGPNGIIATRIELEGTGGAVKFRGTASDLAADVFDIGDVEVNFDVVTTEFVDFGPGGIMEGDFVEVEGTLGGAPFDPPFVVAADLGRIRLREQGIEDQGDLSDVEIEGIVTNFVNLEASASPVSSSRPSSRACSSSRRTPRSSETGLASKSRATFAAAYCSRTP